MKNLIYYSFIVVVLSSCKTESSVEVDTKNIYQAYYLSYDKTENTTTVAAEFRDGGPMGNDLVLDSPSQITVNGDVITHQNIGYLLSYHYYKYYSGEVADAEFVFTDKFGKTFTNNINLYSLNPVDIPSGIITISKSNDFVLTWEGEPLEAAEDISLTILRGEEMVSKSLSQPGATTFTVPKDDLVVFTTGSASIKLEISRMDNIQESTGKGGDIKIRYFVTKDITIEE